MLSTPDFEKKQIIFLIPKDGEKLATKNDNIVIYNKDGSIKHQSSCYRLFMVVVLGNISLTSNLIMKAKKYNFTICMMSVNMRLYCLIGSGIEGNTYLHKRQYSYEGMELAKYIVKLKIHNQVVALGKIRHKVPALKEAIQRLKEYQNKIDAMEFVNVQELMGIEGSAARIYFRQMYDNVKWQGRKPRIKNDFVNATLDIGYTMLFHFVDAILQIYGFDVYCGVLHRNFYMRKSLVCDMIEPFRPIIDWQVRKAINLGQCREEDFEVKNSRWLLKYNMNQKYVTFLMEVILEYKKDIFLFIQGYYRSFMKQREMEQYPLFEMR